MAIMKICPNCWWTGENVKRYRMLNFDRSNKYAAEVEFEKGIITVENESDNICPYCNSRLENTNMTYDEFCLIGRKSNYNREMLRKYLKLSKDDVLEYSFYISRLK